MYVVITGDVIDSKAEENLEEHLESGLDRLNLILKDKLVSKFSSSRGDEIQAVLTWDREIFRTIRRVRYELLPLKLRLGIALGDIGSIDRENSWNMNGKVFHQAREMLEDISKEKEVSTRIWAKGINPYLILFDSHMEEWSRKKWEAFIYYEQLGTIEEVAKKLALSKPSVHQRLQSISYKKLLKAEEVLLTEVFGGIAR